MNSSQPLILASLFGPSLAVQAQIPPQRYDYSYQLYQEDSQRIRVESNYLRGKIDLDDATSFRVQWLSDAISGSSPTGALPTGPQNPTQPYLSDVEDLRTGLLGALSRQFGDHRLELEISRSQENDYLSHGYALSDTWQLNQKNTTISYGFSYLNDLVTVPVLGERDKHGYDLFAGVSQILDKNTVVAANLTIGYNQGYLNDPYKVVQRNEIESIPDGLGGTIEIPVVNIYRENRPDQRFRQVLQLEAKHDFVAADGVLDGILRLGHDDFGVFSQTVQLEWRQSVGSHFQVVPFFRYYRQNAAEFFANTLNGLPIANPAEDPSGSGQNYSADYRLSSLNTVSGGLRLRCQFNDHFSATAAYERYVMSGSGNSADRSPDPSYPNASIWTFGICAEF